MNSTTKQSRKNSLEIQIPIDWEESLEYRKNLLLLLDRRESIQTEEWGGEVRSSADFVSKSSRERISNILWHRVGDPSVYTFESSIPKKLSIAFNEKDYLKRQNKILIRLVFRETLKIMGFKKGESEGLKSQFKHVLEGDIESVELERFLDSIQTEKELYTFSQANTIAWGVIRKELLMQGIIIENGEDHPLWYLKGIIDRFAESRGF